jgi:hypothetical protein
MYHVLVYDKKQVEQFENLFYCKTNEKYDRLFLMYISARKKYYPLLSKNECFKRTVIRYNDNILSRRRLYNDIKHYELPLESYIDKNNETSIPSEALALYASINPRNSVQAVQDLSKDILEKAFSNDIHFFSTIDKTFKNNLHKHSIKMYIGIDLDTKDEKIYQCVIHDLLQFVNIYVVIETRGGYHIIIPKKELKLDCHGANAGKFIYTELKVNTMILIKFLMIYFHLFQEQYKEGLKLNLGKVNFLM